MSLSYINPYDFGKPVREPNVFAGRQKELKEIDYYLELSRGDRPVYHNLGTEHGDVVLSNTGELFDGTTLEGTGVIKVLFPSDVDGDGYVGSADAGIFNEPMDPVMETRFMSQKQILTKMVLLMQIY